MKFTLTSPGLGAAVVVAATALGTPVPAAGQLFGNILSGSPETSVDASGLPTLAPVVERTTPAVVNISVVSKVPTQQNPLLQDPFFRRFFGLPDAPREPQEENRMAAGSGVIVDAAKGYVVTNHHVVDDATEITVTLRDKRRYKATLVGSDPDTDVAVLKIEADHLTALPFGDSGRIKVGDFVIAIGNPFGLAQTVTSGIVSALGRSGLNMEGYEDFIQTDASINPGNSGGALINLRGDLVGINTAIIGPAGGNVGIGFAVPSNMVRAVMDQLIAHGEVRRGRIGVGIQDLTPDLAEALNLPQMQGAVVSQVEAGSPADKAGLRPGDVIVALNGQDIGGSTDLRNRVGLVPLGQAVRLAYVRDGKRAEVSMTVTKANDTGNGSASPPANGPADAGDLPRLGGASFLAADNGVRVTDVKAGSQAARAGLEQGDVIMAINRRPVSSVDDLRQALKESGRALALHVMRGKTTLFIVIR